MDFEWDENKNYQNFRKHGLDFEDAWEIFEGPVLLILIRELTMAKIVGLV